MRSGTVQQQIDHAYEQELKALCVNCWQTAMCIRSFRCELGDRRKIGFDGADNSTDKWVSVPGSMGQFYQYRS